MLCVGACDLILPVRSHRADNWVEGAYSRLVTPGQPVIEFRIGKVILLGPDKARP